MNFLAPVAFWFAATIPVVVLFYLLKRKRVVKLIASTLLWQRFLSDTQANAPFQKLRHNWLLWLQLLMLILAILALSRPYFSGQTTAAALRVIILDASASMQSRDENPSRFERARTDALQLVENLRDRDEALVIEASANAVVKQSATRSKAELRRALRGCQVTDSRTRLTEALKLADTLVSKVAPAKQGRPDAEIHLFTDGAAPELAQFENKGLPIIYHRMGVRGSNLGIVSLDIRENPENRAQRALYTSVANFSTNAQEIQLELLFEKQVVDVRSVTLQPGETSPQVFLASQTRDGVFTVRINAEDDLPADNQASMISLLPQPAKVLLVTRGNRFLEKALRATGNVDLTVAADSTDSADRFDLVVLDDITPTAWPKPNLLAIHLAPTNWFENVSKIEAPVIVDWKNTHPLFRYINFDNIQISESLAVKAPTWAISLLDAQQTPLVLAGELSHQKIVWLGFDTLQSTWPLRISYPMFIGNVVEWLNPVTSKTSQLMLHATEPFRFAPGRAIQQLEAVLPDGSRQSITAGESREILFGSTARQGTYQLRSGTNSTAFCVNVLDAAESNTRPGEELAFGKFNKVAATTLQRGNREFWRWCAAFAILVLLGEWWYYHRRTA